MLCIVVNLLVCYDIPLWLIDNCMIQCLFVSLFVVNELKYSLALCFCMNLYCCFLMRQSNTVQLYPLNSSALYLFMSLHINALIVSVRLWRRFASICLAFDIHHWRFDNVMYQSPFLILSLYTLRDENRRDLMDMDISYVHDIYILSRYNEKL